MPEVPNIFILTGAGVSAESGIATFRGPGGLWEGHRVEDVATPEAFIADPELVYRFYNERRRGVLTKEPNGAHRAIAKLQKGYPGKVTLVTQNIDDLHERGGSPAVHHMHGELLKSRCLDCDHVEECLGDIDVTSRCPECSGKMRPHIVWFGEMPLGLDEIFSALDEAPIFAAIGTSGLVYPAAGFVEHAKQQHARCLEFNLEETAASRLFHEHHFGPASETVSAWVENLLEES